MPTQTLYQGSADQTRMAGPLDELAVKAREAIEKKTGGVFTFGFRIGALTKVCPPLANVIEASMESDQLELGEPQPGGFIPLTFTRMSPRLALVVVEAAKAQAAYLTTGSEDYSAYSAVVREMRENVGEEIDNEMANLQRSLAPHAPGIKDVKGELESLLGDLEKLIGALDALK